MRHNVRNTGGRNLFRGSRKHVLDWTESPDFATEFTTLLEPVPVEISASDPMMPRGYRAPDEARLDRFGPVWHSAADWDALQDWWLVHRRGANTPNWDIAAGCTIEGVRGFVLVEAKANRRELKEDGKPLQPDASDASRDNDACIREAVEDANRGWNAIVPGVRLSCDSHYQLANRLAFTWKLARMGIPSVLVYLGFTGDDGLESQLQPFIDEEDWADAFATYRSPVAPESLFERRHLIGSTPAWVISRSRPVIEASPLAGS
jgi:hypothetical protein